jgi:hypothetical protein
MVYWVASESVPGRRYRVDLVANGGAGQCDCPDFRTRRQLAIDEGEESWGRSTSCKHTRKAARYFMRELFAALAQSESKPPAEHHAPTTNPTP